MSKYTQKSFNSPMRIDISRSIGLLDLFLISISFIFISSSAIGNYLPIVEITSLTLSMMAGLLAVGTFTLKQRNVRLAPEQLLSIAILVSLLLVITAQVLFTQTGTVSAKLLQQFSLYIFLLITIRSRLNSKVLLVCSLLVSIINFPFAFRTLTLHGTFQGSNTSSPLANSHDTAFILALFAILNLICFRFSPTRSKAEKLHFSLGVLFLLEILGYRAFAPLLLLIIFVLLLFSRSIHDSSLNLRFLFWSSFFVFPILFFMMQFSSLSHAADYGNLYRYSSTYQMLGSGRVGAWIQTIGELKYRQFLEFSLGTGTGSDVREIAIWQRDLGSHSYFLSLAYEYGFPFMLLTLIFLLLCIQRLPTLQKTLLISVLCSASLTSGLMWGRTLPNLMLAIVFIHLRNIDFQKFVKDDRN